MSRWNGSVGPRTLVIEPHRPGVLRNLAEVWRHRHLIPFFGHRFLAKRYMRTWLGVVWLPLRPALSTAVRLFVFGGLIGIATRNVAYPIFFFVATACWMLFAESALWATRSLEINRKLVARVHVPRLALILGAVLPAAVESAIVAGFAVLATIYYVLRADIFYLDLGLHTLFVPAGLALLVLLGLGVGLLLSGPAARARDFRFGVAYGLSFLYFLTPVIYPLTAIPEAWRGFAGLNPVTGAMEMVKAGLFEAQPLSLKSVIVTLSWVGAMWGLGLWLFNRREVAVVRRGGAQGAEVPRPTGREGAAREAREAS